MNLGRKISQIAKLSELKPDKRWETTTKYDLLAEISSQNRMMQAQKLSGTEKADLVVMQFMNKVAPSFTKMIAAFLIVVMGSGVGIAAQASVPGEMLWPLKRGVIEKVELSLAITSDREALVHIKHVKNRIEEIKEILEETDTQPEKIVKKEKAIKQAVRHLEKDVTSVDTSLKIVKEEKKPIEVVELAKKVTDTTKEVAVALEEKSGTSEDKNIEEALDSVKAVNQEVQKSAVNVALEVHDEVIAMVKQKEEKNNAPQSTTTVDGVPEVAAEVVDTLDMPEVIEDMSNDTSTVDMIAEQAVEEVVNEDLDINDEEIEAVKSLVKEMIASEIDNTSSEVEVVKKEAETVAPEDLATIKEEAVLTEENEDLAGIDTLETTSEEVDKILNEAKQLMEDGFLRDAFEKISQVQEDYKKADIVLKRIKEAIANHKMLDAEIINQLGTDNAQADPAESVSDQEGSVEASAIDKAVEVKETESVVIEEVTN